MFFPEGANAFWLPLGVAVGLLLIEPKHRWPWWLVFFAFCDLLYAKLHFGHWSLPDDPIKALLVAGLATKLEAKPTKPRWIPKFFLASVVGCALGQFTLLAWGSLTWASWYQWMMGDVLGLAVGTPLILLWSQRPTEKMTREVAQSLLYGLPLEVLLVSWSPKSSEISVALPFLVLPIALLLAIRLPLLWVAWHGSILAILASFEASRGLGPIYHLTENEVIRVVNLDCFLMVLVLAPLWLASQWSDQSSSQETELSLLLQHQHLESVYQGLFETSATGLVVVDQDLVVAANPQAGRLLGQETIGLSWSSLNFSTLELEVTDSQLTKTLRLLTLHEVTQERNLQRSLETEAERLSRRVSERREELQAANEKLELSGRLKGEFLAHVSHELKTPLTSIVVRVATLTEGLHGPLGPRSKVAVEDLNRATERLHRLVEDALELAKLEAQRYQVEVQVVQLKAVAEIPLKRLGTHLPISDTLTVKLDPAFLVRILELVGSHLQQAQCSVEVELEDRSTEVQLRFLGFGPKFSTQRLNLLLDPYAQRSEEDRGAWTGFRLALANRLAQCTGANLKVQERPGQQVALTLCLQKE